MPKGVPLPNVMDNEVSAMFYHCLKNNEGVIDFDKVATELGLPDATFARKRLRRCMQAQEKGIHQSASKHPTIPSRKPAKKAVLASEEAKISAKKRKLETDESENEGEGAGSTDGDGEESGMGNAA